MIFMGVVTITLKIFCTKHTFRNAQTLVTTTKISLSCAKETHAIRIANEKNKVKEDHFVRREESDAHATMSGSYS
jgi:hypothetical protein